MLNLGVEHYRLVLLEAFIKLLLLGEDLGLYVGAGNIHVVSDRRKRIAEFTVISLG